MTAAFPYRTSPSAAAVTKDLTIKETVFAELGVSAPTQAQEDQMDKYIHQVSALIVGYLDLDVAEQGLIDYFRTADRTDVDVLRLSRRPVTAIASITEDGDTVDSADYELNGQTGQVWRLSGGSPSYWRSCSQIVVTFTAGYELLETLPDDIERACIDQIKALWAASDRDPTLRSFNVPDVLSETYSVAGGDSYGNSGLLVQVEKALDPYKRGVL